MGFLQILAWSPALLITAVFIVKLYFKWSAGVCRSKRRIDGQVAIVTGSNTGIGLETAKELARRGAKVILAVRDVNKGQAACDEIIQASGNKKVFVKSLDVSSLESVRAFCKEFKAEESRLDILVNNAGVAGVRRSFTADGLETQFATNHFGPFLLTNILVGEMKKTGGRIVLVSSLAHKWTKELDLENLNSERKWEPKLLYARTKLSNILMVKELDRRLKAAGVSNIYVNAVNPGGVKTEIFRHAKKLFKYMIMISQIFFKTPEEGAQPSIHLCVSEEIEGQSGLYWTDCKKDDPSKLAKDPEVAKGLWEKSCEFVKLSPSETYV